MPDTKDYMVESQPVSRRARLGEVALIFLIFLVFGGALPPHVNESHYLCRAKHFWNPQWAPGDMFLESPESQPVFVLVFGWTTRWLSLPATAWVGRVICWLLLAIAWRQLTARVVRQPLAAALAAALLLTFNRIGHFSGEWLVGGVEAKCFAYPFVVAGLAALVGDRWNRAWILLGVATAFHPLVGGWSTLACVFVWLVTERRWQTFTSMMPGLLAGGIIAMAGIVPALQLSSGQPEDVIRSANRIYVFDRLPHHLIPMTHRAGQLLEWSQGYLLLLFSLLFFGVSVWLMGRKPATSSDRAGNLTESESVSFLALNRLRWFALFGVVLVGVGLLIELVFRDDPEQAAGLLKFYWFRLNDFAVPLALSFHVVALVTLGLQRGASWGVALLMVSLALAGWQIVTTLQDRLDRPIPPADYKAIDYRDWVDVCEWVGRNTPADALVLTPRRALSFKWRAGRAEVVNRKDVPQDAAGVVAWRDRMRTIHEVDVDGKRRFARSVAKLGTERIQELARQYHFDYVVVKRTNFDLPAVYRNNSYVVYRTSPGD